MTQRKTMSSIVEDTSQQYALKRKKSYTRWREWKSNWSDENMNNNCFRLVYERMEKRWKFEISACYIRCACLVWNAKMWIGKKRCLKLLECHRIFLKLREGKGNFHTVDCVWMEECVCAIYMYCAFGLRSACKNLLWWQYLLWRYIELAYNNFLFPPLIQ